MTDPLRCRIAVVILSLLNMQTFNTEESGEVAEDSPFSLRALSSLCVPLHNKLKTTETYIWKFNMQTLRPTVLALSLCSLTVLASVAHAGQNELTEAESRSGWKLLARGQSVDHADQKSRGGAR